MASGIIAAITAATALAGTATNFLMSRNTPSMPTVVKPPPPPEIDTSDQDKKTNDMTNNMITDESKRRRAAKRQQNTAFNQPSSINQVNQPKSLLGE